MHILFIFLEIITALVLRTAGVFLFSFYYHDYDVATSVSYIAFIVNVATFLGIWIIGGVHLKYLGKLNYFWKAVILSIAGLFVFSLFQVVLLLFNPGSVHHYLNTIIGFLPMAGGLIGFNYFLLNPFKQA